MTPFTVPRNRIRQLNESAIRADGSFVLYWMTAFRRCQWNYSLQHARDWAAQLQRPLLVLEGLRSDYPWACDRFHRFVIEGMMDNRDFFAKTGVSYYPYVEPKRGAAKGLIDNLAAQACLIIGDDFPCFFYPEMYRRLSERIPCRMEIVDANGLMPMTAADRTFTVAHSYRRWMQKNLPDHLQEAPELQPLTSNTLKRIPKLTEPPAEILAKWPKAILDHLLSSTGLTDLPIDHRIKPVSQVGGTLQASALLGRFIRDRLATYDNDRNKPDLRGSTELSAYLHFGHLSAHELFWSIMDSQSWHAEQLSKPNGKVNGFWGVNQQAEALLDQLCTWREIGFNFCHRQADYDQYQSLPAWAQETLRKHATDRRPYLYTLEQLELAQTHDPIWNAAQRQLLTEGRIHNYLRMLWGKKIVHWSPSPEIALEWMIELNNKYALDGRDPNSYSGIFWVLGRYDRPWGPEREIFGKVRYMASENTAKKHALQNYLQRFAKLPDDQEVG